jgi:Ca2+-transporting ATPase
MRRAVALERVAGLLDEERGLSQSEVEERRAVYGRNDIIETPRGGWRDLIRDTAKDPMIWFLAATSGLFAAVGDRTEALIMIGAIAPILGMDAFLHRRTQASTEGLRSRLAERATVVRDGERAEVPAAGLVPGDLVLVRAGEPFPADGLVVGGESLQADESALTGEAFPVRKEVLREALPAAGEAPVEAPVEGVHWGFAGTRLLTGDARVRIVDTGARTLYGEIVRSAVHGAHARTPLQRSIANLVTALLVAAGALCLALAWIRWRQGHGIVDALISAVTLAVAAIPEEFPVAFAFFLGVGTFRLAKRQALVRRAVVVENIGRASCICSDKTGTLTEGRIRVAHFLAAKGVEPRQLLRVAALASRDDSGDPLDAAIGEAAGGADDAYTDADADAKADADANADARARAVAAAWAAAGAARIATYPFTEARRRETALYGGPFGVVAAAKGAPETILAMCSLADAARETWQCRVRAFAESGHKVVACAWKDLPRGELIASEPDSGYTFAGLLACEDPVREGVPEAVRQAKEAGIHVIMITGDHPVTAAAVAREVGIGEASPVTIDGDELEAEIIRDGGRHLRCVDVIARAVPAQKLSLVRALQAQGEVVAVTGDGVNDVPAIQAADIGIAMGERGTRSAREVAAIVLLDDNFRTIINAIAEGRQLFRNLRLSFAYLLMIHIPLVVTAALIPLAGYPLLYLPVHIVWLELIIHPTALLVFQELPPDARLRATGRRERSGKFFTGAEWAVVAAVGIVTTLVVVGGYVRSLHALDVEHARATALVALVVASAALTGSLSGLRTWTARVIFAASVGSALFLVQAPWSASLLNLEPLHAGDWMIAALGGVVPGLLALFLPGRAARRRAIA